jgi:phosphatidylglycerophosphate synthase
MVPSIKELRKLCQNTKTRDIQTSHYWGKIPNFFSAYLTKFFLQTHITANQVTFLMLICGIISAIFFSIGQYIYSLIGILFYTLYLFLDYSDGEVARYNKTFSVSGAYLDYMTHVIVNPLIIVGISIGVFFNNPLPIPNSVFLVAGLSAAYFFMIGQFTRLKKYELYLDKGDAKKLTQLRMKFKGSPVNKIKEIFHNFFRMTVFNAVFVFGILNLFSYLVLIYAVILPATSILRFYSEFKKED